MNAARGRSRRAVRPAGTAGTDDAVLRSTLPATAPGLGTTATGTSGPGTAAPVTEPALPGRSVDDTDIGWGEVPDGNDDRLRQDKPPHW